jgi:hypothetical protein
MIALLGLGGIELLFILFLGFFGTIFWIWMLIDCATNEPSHGNEKIAWIVIIVLTHWLGALIYFLARRPKRIAETGK